MMGLGIVLALNHMYDNWTIAGVMSAAYVLATAAVTPLYARLFDRFGQRKVGPVILTVQVIVMLGFAFAALMRVPIPLLFVLAVVMGMTQFSFGALVRTRRQGGPAQHRVCARIRHRRDRVHLRADSGGFPGRVRASRITAVRADPRLRVRRCRVLRIA